MTSDDEDWPFTIQHDPKFGHYMVRVISLDTDCKYLNVLFTQVATRDIKQMELILREWPVVVGPYTKTDPGLHCVECFKRVGAGEGVYDEVSGYPLCSDKCRHGPNHKVRPWETNSATYPALFQD